MLQRTFGRDNAYFMIDNSYDVNLRFYVKDETFHQFSLVCTTFYFACQQTTFHQLTPFAKDIIQLYYSKMPSSNNNNNSNNNIKCVLIEESDLVAFIQSIYHGLSQNINLDYYGLINHHHLPRSQLLIRKYGYYNQRENKYQMSFIQFKKMYLDIYYHEPQRVWSEFCVFTGQNNNNIPPQLLSPWKTQLYTEIADYSNDDYKHTQRIHRIKLFDLKLKNGNYNLKGDFLCEDCWTNYIGKLSERYYPSVFDLILKILCTKPELWHENVIQLHRTLQWILTNDFD